MTDGELERLLKTAGPNPSAVIDVLPLYTNIKGWFDTYKLKALLEHNRPHTLARRSDPETSKQAAISLKDVSARQQMVWGALKFIGKATQEELVERYGNYKDVYAWGQPLEMIPQSPQSIRTRLVELGRAGLVERTDEKRPTRSGRQAYVWRVR